MPKAGIELQEWRNSLKQCCKCRLLPDGREINPSDSKQLLHALIHYEPKSNNGFRTGWATAMLDKIKEPKCKVELLEVSCQSGILAVMEAPNYRDTYQLTKGYITCDTDTDETGKRIRRLLQHIDVLPETVVFTNAVQCLPAARGNGFPPTSKQRRNCRGHLRRLLDLMRPKVVLAFGNEALKELHRLDPIAIDGRLLRLDEVTVSQLVGRCIMPWGGTCLVPLYHPGPLVVNNAFRKDGTPGTGRSESEQKQDINVISSLIQS